MFASETTLLRLVVLCVLWAQAHGASPHAKSDTGNAASVQNRSELAGKVEFFSHIMHTGGTAWSHWLTRVYGADSVAPGSATAAPMFAGMRPPYFPQFDELQASLQKCADDPECDRPEYSVAYGHSPPNFLLKAGLDKDRTYSATILRDPIDMAIHVNMASICYESQLPEANLTLRLWEHDHVKEACKNSMSLGAWVFKHKPKQRLRPVHDEYDTSLGSLKIYGQDQTALKLTNRLSQVDWLLGCKPQPTKEKLKMRSKDTRLRASGTDKNVSSAKESICSGDLETRLQRAGNELSAMPWFGIMSNWVGSTCLWHFVHKIPFADHEGARRRLKQRSAKARAKAQGRQNMRAASHNSSKRAHHRSAETQQVDEPSFVSTVRGSQNFIRNLSPTSVIRNFLLTLRQQRIHNLATTDDERGLEGYNCTGTACLKLQSHARFVDEEWMFFQEANALFQQRMTQASLELEALDARPWYLPDICFEQTPPNGFAI